MQCFLFSSDFTVCLVRRNSNSFVVPFVSKDWSGEEGGGGVEVNSVINLFRDYLPVKLRLSCVHLGCLVIVTRWFK